QITPMSAQVQRFNWATRMSGGSRARCAAPRARGRRTASSTRRSRVPLRGADRARRARYEITPNVRLRATARPARRSSLLVRPCENGAFGRERFVDIRGTSGGLLEGPNDQGASAGVEFRG